MAIWSMLVVNNNRAYDAVKDTASWLNSILGNYGDTLQLSASHHQRNLFTQTGLEH